MGGKSTVLIRCTKQYEILLHILSFFFFALCLSVFQSYEEKLEKANLQAKVDILQDLSKKCKGAGPVVDCVVFHNGSEWR